MFSKGSLEGKIKHEEDNFDSCSYQNLNLIRSDKENAEVFNDVDDLVDRLISIKKVSSYNGRVKNNYPVSSLQKYEKEIKTSRKANKKPHSRKILSVALSIILILVVIPSTLPQLYGSTTSDISVSIYPESVYNDDIMFVNVTTPSSHLICYVTADMADIETVNLSLVDNSTLEHLWQAVWVAHDVVPGEHIVTITALDVENTSHSTSARWSVLPEENPDVNQSLETGMNETYAEGNESYNETTPPINVDDGNMTGNVTIISTGLNLPLNSDKPTYVINETVLISGIVSFNNSLINTSADLLITSSDVYLSIDLNVSDGIFEYSFIPVATGEYVVNATVNYLNETAEEEIVFDVSSVSFENISLNVPDLHIWDDTDTVSKYVDDLIMFYANYSSENLSIENASCLISFNVGSWTAPVSMNFSDGIYVYNRSFDIDGTYEYRVWCSAVGFENKSVMSECVISITESDIISITEPDIFGPVSQIEVGSPVLWKQKFQTEVNLKVNISRYAYNITVNGIVSEEDVIVLEKEIIKSLKDFNIDKRNHVLAKGVKRWLKRVERNPDNVQYVQELYRLYSKLKDSISLEEILDETYEDIERYITQFIVEDVEIQLLISDTTGDIEITYLTEGPEILEEQIGEGRKQITVSSDIHYKEILAYTELPVEASSQSVKLYHLINGTRQEVSIIKFDLNGNSLIDYIEWIVPSLSNQTYELIIEISNAEHLDENRNFISDIYYEVYQLDNVWSETIPAEHYIRVTFKQPLDNTRDITLYPRIVNDTPRIEVYEVDGNEIISEFQNLTSNVYNKVFLTSLNGSQDTFDLLVLDGDIEVDHIIDPAPTQNGEVPANESTGISTTLQLNVTVDDIDDDTLTAYWYSNSSGSWALFATNSSIDTSGGAVNIIQTNSNFSDYNKTYWWSINLTDSILWTNITYHFTTSVISTSVDSISPYIVGSSPLTITAIGPTDLDNVTLYYRWSSDNISWPANTEWYNIFTETFPNTDYNWEGDDEGDTHQDEYWFVSDTSDTNDIAVDPSNEGTISPQTSPPALHMEDFNDASQWVEARADSGLNYWNPSDLGWVDGYINFTYAWHADNNEGIQFWTWNGTSAELQWYEYSSGNNQEQEWTTYSWQLPQWALDETEFAFRFEILGNGGGDEVYVDNVTLEVKINHYIWSEFSNDVSYPWQWSFNFPNSTGYYEFYSIGNKSGSPNETSPASADALCRFNRPPTITNEIPSNGSTNIQATPLMNITVNDVDGDTMTITWYSNSSGSWQLFGTNNSVGNGTYHQTNNNFSEPYTTYYWYINVSDGLNTNTSGLYYYFTTEKTVPTVTTNASTGVEETNATLHGYLSDDGGESCTVRFEWGTTTSYGTNTTNQTKTDGQTFSQGLIGLSNGTLYHYRAYANNTVSSDTGIDMTFLTKPQPPTNLVAQMNNSNTIYLTWNTGDGRNTTYIERNTSSNWARGEGTLIYNGTASLYEDSGLTQGTTYYYQAWSYTNWTTGSSTLHQWSDNNASANNKTNNIPTIDVISPANGSTDISIQPMCQIWANDTDGDTLTVFWYENTTASWVLRQTNNSVTANSTLNWTFSQANNYGITYWWKVAINDSRDNITAWFYFTTEALNTSIDTISPYLVTSSPLTITATNSTTVDNVNLYYRWSDDNSSWGHSGETEQNTPTIDSFVETDMIAETTELTSDSWSHTCGNYDDDVLVVCFGYENDDATTTVISSIEYAGNSLTKACSYLADEGATDALADIWYLLNPPTGTDIVYVNFSSTVRGGWGGSLSIYNVKQVAPIVNGSTDIGTPTSASTDITTIVDNSIIIDCVTEGYDGGGMTAGAGQTEFFDGDGSAFSCNVGGSYELRTTVGTETITQSWGADGYRYAHAIVAFEPTNTTWGNGTNWAVWNNATNPDTESPWSWNFNFPNSTGYYEFYSIGNKSGSPNETTPVSADAICHWIENTSINATPSQWNQGDVWVASSNATTGFYFNFTNEGNLALNIQIKASNATNSTTGAEWKLNSTQGHDNFTLQYNKSDGGSWTNINTTYDTFVTDLDINAWQTFDLNLIMATTSSTSDPLSIVVTFKSVVS